MFSSLVPWLMLVGPQGGDPLRPPDLFPNWLSRQYEQIRRTQREDDGRIIAFYEAEIVWHERYIREFAAHLSPGELKWHRKHVEEMREHLRKMKVLERAYVQWDEERAKRPGWATDRAALVRIERLFNELWPPDNVAPMPREVKK